MGSESKKKKKGHQDLIPEKCSEDVMYQGAGDKKGPGKQLANKEGKSGRIEEGIGGAPELGRE